MYGYEHFNLCPRCLETIPPLDCCVFCNYADDDSAIREQDQEVGPEFQRIRSEVNKEMKFLESIL
jgi:hypothetical protein